MSATNIEHDVIMHHVQDEFATPSIHPLSPATAVAHLFPKRPQHSTGKAVLRHSTILTRCSCLMQCLNQGVDRGWTKGSLHRQTQTDQPQLLVLRRNHIAKQCLHPTLFRILDPNFGVASILPLPLLCTTRLLPYQDPPQPKLALLSNPVTWRDSSRNLHRHSSQNHCSACLCTHPPQPQASFPRHTPPTGHHVQAL